jgi:hypothetical protein
MDASERRLLAFYRSGSWTKLSGVFDAATTDAWQQQQQRWEGTC